MVTILCAATAIQSYLIWPPWSYWMHWAYIQCIGTACWFFSEAGVFLLRRPTDTGIWPRGARGVLVAVTGFTLGVFAGSRLGIMLLGIHTPPPGSTALSALDSALNQFRPNRVYSVIPGVPGFMTLSAILTVNTGVVACFFFYSLREQNVLSAKITAAERDAAEASLKLLTAQLEPRMLFNTLANLRALIANDPRRALAMLDRLDRYLRITLGDSMTLTHSLAVEFNRLADYLALMQVRMGPRLHYTLELPAELHHASVPPLLLQPLVENSIRHGLGSKGKGVEITARARRDGQRLVIEVHDTENGLDKADTATGNDFGLAQIRQRLMSIYGEATTLELTSTPGGGTRVTLMLPCVFNT